MKLLTSIDCSDIVYSFSYYRAQLNLLCTLQMLWQDFLLPSGVRTLAIVVQIFTFLVAVVNISAVVAVYEKSGKHTYAPASLLVMNMLIVLLLIPIFYKWLVHRSTKRIPLYKASIYPMPATHSVDEQRGVYLFCSAYH